MSQEDTIADLADDLGCSYGEAERMLKKQERPRVEQITAIGPKARRLSYREVISRAKGAGRDWARATKTWMDMAPGKDFGEDFGGYIEDAAYDIADGLLYELGVFEAASRQCGTRDRQLLKEILADWVATGAQQVK